MSQYTNKQIRDFLTEFFADDEEEFEFFCDDNYAEVKQMFEPGISAKRRAHLLTQHCAETNSFERLLTLLQETYPDKYTQTGLPLGQPDTQTAPPPVQPQVTISPETPSPIVSPATEPAQEPEGQNLFISYSRRDETFIKQLYQELTGRGLSAWYDRFNIGVGTQWAGEIVKGIRDCQVFVLVLSPDSAASPNVRKEVDLAQRYQKQIIPLMWRPVEIPVAMEYQLAGIQWIDFNEMVSQEKFVQLADVAKRLIGGASMSEAVSGKAIARESTIPAIPAEIPAPAGEERKLGGLKKKGSGLNPIAIGGLVISGVVTTFGLDTADQDLVNGELKWLFNAADHLLQVGAGQVGPNQPIAQLPNSPTPQRLSLTLASAFGPQVEKILSRIKNHLDNLNLALMREVQLGEAGKTDMELQSRLRGQRLDIVENLRELASLMEQAYGVLISSPDQLAEFLKTA
jgi:hypothetical protein